MCLKQTEFSIILSRCTYSDVPMFYSVPAMCSVYQMVNINGMCQFSVYICCVLRWCGSSDMSKDFISTHLKQCWGVASHLLTLWPSQLQYLAGVVVTRINSKGEVANCRACSGESPGREDNMSASSVSYQWVMTLAVFLCTCTYTEEHGCAQAPRI